MGTTPNKRPASRSPLGARAAKRQAPSTPEEGELDDPSPPPKSTLPPPPPTLPAKPIPKFPFPFKKKAEVPRNASGSSIAEPRDTLMSGTPERPEEDEQRAREREGSSRWRPNRAGDHWEPSYTRGNERGDRYYPPQPRWQHRARSPLGTHSPPPSRSPTSPSSHHDKHRLPGLRSPDAAFSPPSRREHDRYPDRHRNDSWRAWEDDDDRRYRGRHDNEDRHYRPRDDREWTRRDDDRRGDHRRGRSRDAERNRRDNYRAVSPGSIAAHPSSLTPKGSITPRPRSPIDSALHHQKPPQAPCSPPPPPSATPPPPPPESLQKDDSLPSTHASVTIAMTRPPLRAPSPPRVSLTSAVLPAKPPPPLPSGPPPEKNGNPEAKPPDLQRVRPVRRREIVRRTPKDEMAAYQRQFSGCGHQADYDLTTKLGEGTFGEVHKAIQKKTGTVVALKRILMHNEKEGMPVTALREIKILKALKHPCIVDILDMFVVRSTEKDPLSVYMVFPYMDHDLAGLLENERVKLQPSHVKLYMKQLLEGTEYMHRNHILHRDMKAANLLISNNGSLKIADLGLARSFDPNITRGGLDPRGRERKYTNCVVTRWYRPPELLLGARQYGGEVDIWGIGCVFGEMFSRRPILPGTSDLDQLEKIWQLCGTPNQHTWPNFDALPGCDGVKRFAIHPRRVKQAYESVGSETADLLDKLLICNPRERISASQALGHDYFWTDPLPADPKTLPVYEASHEFDKRAHRNHHPPAPPPMAPAMPNQPYNNAGQQYNNASQPYNNAGPPPGHFNRNGPPPPPTFYPGGPPNSYQQYPPPPGGPFHGQGPGFQPPPHGYPPNRGHFQPPPPPGIHPNNYHRGGRPGGFHHRGGYGGPGPGGPKGPLPNRPMHLPPKPVMPQGAPGDRLPPPPPLSGRPNTTSANVQLNYG